MAIDYDQIRVNTAERLIRENGKQAFIITPGTATGHPSNPIPGTPTRDMVYFVETRYSMTDRNATLVQVGDKMGIISTETGIVPEKSVSKIEIDGTIYQLLDVSPLNPGGVVMLYKIHARK